MSSVRDKKDIFTAEFAESAEKRLKEIGHGPTRTEKLGGWEGEKVKAFEAQG